jgi:SAM-dependent methyltransferase
MTETMTEPTREDVERFLATTDFSGYQAIPLPHGLAIPGKDRTRRADQILGGRIRGKSLLDVGTYYGFFPYEAMRRGATRAVGIEADPERCAIAKRIAELHGNPYEIREGLVEDQQFDESFDVVLLLNVLHHVLDPVGMLRQLAAICRETLIVEFCLTDDPECISRLGGGPRKKLARTLARARSMLLRAAAWKLPIMAVADIPYHRTFYFSREAFRNLFVVHHRLFDEVEFLPTRMKRRRAVAICKPAK